MRLSYTITQTYGRTRRSAIIASEIKSKQLINQVYPRETGATSEAHLLATLIKFDKLGSLLWSYIIWMMFLLIFITKTAIHIAYPYVASDKFFFTEPDKEVQFFLQQTETATLWNEIKINFITRSPEGQNKLRHRLEVQYRWPGDMNGIRNAQQNAEGTTQKRQQKQRYMDYNLRGLKPNFCTTTGPRSVNEVPKR